MTEANGKDVIKIVCRYYRIHIFVVPFLNFVSPSPLTLLVSEPLVRQEHVQERY